MREEWLNRIAITWGNRTRQRQLREVLDRYDSATAAIAHHPDMVSREVSFSSFNMVSRSSSILLIHNIDTFWCQIDQGLNLITVICFFVV